MTASIYHTSDQPFLGAFFVWELYDNLEEERVSKYFSHFNMADGFMMDVESEYPDSSFFIACVENEEVLQYILSVEQGENDGK